MEFLKYNIRIILVALVLIFIYVTIYHYVEKIEIKKCGNCQCQNKCPQVEGIENEKFDETYADKLMELSNSERENKFKENECLTKMAKKRVLEMQRENYFSHTAMNGRKPYLEMIPQCYQYVWTYGENLTKDYATPEYAHAGLMASPLHKKNIINPKYQEAGYACYKRMCVQFFAGF